MTDPFDIDFGSGVAGSQGNKKSHFVNYSKTDPGEKVIPEMIERYGIGISVKVTGLTKQEYHLLIWVILFVYQHILIQ